MSDTSNKKEKKVVPFTIKRNLLFQFVYFPLIFTAIILIPLAVCSIIKLSIGLSPKFSNAYLLNSVSVVVAFITGGILAKRVRTVAPETAKYNKLITFTSLAVNALVIFNVYFNGGVSAAKYACFIINPLFILSNLMFNFILENSIIMVMFFAIIAYGASFLIFSEDAFKASDDKPKEKTVIPFTIKRNMMFQFVYFPLIFTGIIILPLAFCSFINMFISSYTRNDFAIAIIFSGVSMAVAFLIGRILAKRVRAIAPETAKYNRLLTFTSLAINILVIFVVYLAGGVSAAKYACFVVNPLFILDNLMFNFILENSIIMIMFLSIITYNASFLLFSRSAFKTDDQKQTKVFAVSTAIITTIAILVCSLAVYPEVEYSYMKHKYERIPFTEEVDYNFYLNFPFDSENSLIRIDEKLSIDFVDINTTPRLDGATAFYPVYAAIAQSSYSGLKKEIEANGFRYTSDYWGGDNIYLYDPYEYQQAEPLLDICSQLIRCTQTTNAYNGLADGNSDIVFAFKPSDEQIAYAASKGVEFELTLIGYDAFCFFVNNKNPVNNLTIKQIQDIYSGKITNWNKVGGKNKRIFTFTRPKNSGSQTIMENDVMKNIPINAKFESKVVQTMGQIIVIVDSYLNTSASIGYTFMYYSSNMVTGESIKYIAIDGVSPTHDTVRTGTYLFSTPFYAVTVKGQQTAETKQLLEWLTGTQGQYFIEQCGYVGK